MLAFACNVGVEEDVVNVIAQVQAEVGRIDVLVNAAGICGSKPIQLDTFTSIWKDIQVNLGGVCDAPILTISALLTVL